MNVFNFRIFPNELEIPSASDQLQIRLDYSDSGEIGRVQIYNSAVDGMVTVDLFDFESEFPAEFARLQQAVYQEHKSNQLSKILFGT